VLEREHRPVSFVVSLRLGSPPSFEPVRARLEVYPWLRFKLDGTPDWPGELIEQLVETGAVVSIDFKGAYKGTPVDVDTDPELYRRVARAFPDAWLEDPDLEDGPAREALAAHQDRITWDAPIHSVDDVLALPFPPRVLNVKPSRFGPLRRLLDFYDWCAGNDVRNYGGGQFELGPGRGQIQYLASLFHADEPNDVAPGGFNAPVRPGLPVSPLAAPDAAIPGFRG
jgi:hypothetical protein